MNRWFVILLVMIAVICLPQLLVSSPLTAAVIAVAGVCLVIWLSEIAPPFVPTILLWALIPLVVAPFDPSLSLARVLDWAADPVLALFLGGFAMGVAAELYGLDRQLIAFAIRYSGGSYRGLLFLVIFLTAFLSMWLSNIAAAALMFACLRTWLAEFGEEDLGRRMLLLGVALGADLGGIATPIGTGPNAVAIASISETMPVSFIGWMVFAFPLTIGMLIISYIFLVWRNRTIVASEAWRGYRKQIKPVSLDEVATRQRGILICLMVVTILFWLAEPIHGIPAAVISLCTTAALFLLGTLSKESLRKIDWSTLLLISGGITLGKLLEATNTVGTFIAEISLDGIDPRIGLFVLCLFTALLAALMSNTASVIMMIPIATALIPSPSTPIIIAISASFGIPFIISTPPNAMAYGEGGLRATDLLWPGLLIMISGCFVVSFTGREMLALVGFR
ncbi:SLC13 family permease [Leptolyngbya sp. 7M]|uniref:SLC13 family permease n=1 Tax=Leptolyngbya sp. 7M TaxID=2812896 RepID=UPI001B8AEF8A|nr:SLC13 family permease [Leptolyngbya sp. 7M]QYO66239.1 anion permease [Leptolyngbya sp. 7M]